MTEPRSGGRGLTRRELLGRSGALTTGLLFAAACGGGRGAGGGGGSDPGITDSEVILGGSYPMSGPASAYGTIGKSAKAYFKKLNAEGGLKMADGKTRKVTFIVYDDGYEPSRMLENARRLVEQDRVFALFNTLGTPTNSAIVDYVNERGVPHLFLATGASKWGSNTEKWPWTIGWQPAYSLESAIYAEYLKREKPGATVAVLFQNDDYGHDYLSGFETAIEGSDIEIAARESYQVTDPSVDSQVVNLARSKADVFFNVTTPKFAAQAITKKAEAGWDALHLLNNVSTSIESVLKPAGLEASQGVVTANYIKDAADPRFVDDPEIKKYMVDAEKYGNFNVLDPYGIFGFAVSGCMAQVLQDTDAPNRKTLMEVVRSMDYANSLLLPDVGVKTSADDGFPIESEQLMRFEGTQWKPFSGLIRREGNTPT